MHAIRTTAARLLRLGVAAAITACLGVTSALADWPTKPVRVIYNYPPGTGGDVVTRAVAEELHKKLGQPFVVENRAGASGTVGVEAASRMTGDGYTILASPNSALVLLPRLRKVSCDPLEFKPIAAMGEYIYAWSVLPSLGVKSVAELIALAKQKPGQLSYTSPGVGSATNLRGESLNLAAGVDITHIPYRGGPDALNDFLAGRVSVMLDNAQFPQVKAGKVINLAVTSSKRHPDFPDVPTMTEAGYNIELPTWLAFYAIKGTPDEVGQKLAPVVAEIMARPEIKRRLLDIGFFAMEETGQQIAEMNRREVAAFEHWVKRTGIKID